MTDKDYPEFLKTMVALAEILGPKELSETMLTLYWRVLKDLPTSQFKMAVEIVAKTAKFFPKPSEILAAVTPDMASISVMALERVLRTVDSKGTYASVAFDDPAIHAAIESMGGWTEFGRRELDEWFRKDFAKYYEIHYKRAAVGDLEGIPPVLIGIADAENFKKSGGNLSYTVVGSEEKYLAWTSAAARKKELSGFRTLQIEAKGLSQKNQEKKVQ